MRNIDKIYMDGAFVQPHGTEQFDLFNPATENRIGVVRLGDAEDVRMAVAAARKAFPTMARTSKAERIAILRRLRDAVNARTGDLIAAMTEEYGAPAYFTGFSVQNTASVFEVMAASVENYAFERTAGSSAVTMLPLGGGRCDNAVEQQFWLYRDQAGPCDRFGIHHRDQARRTECDPNASAARMPA